MRRRTLLITLPLASIEPGGLALAPAAESEADAGPSGQRVSTGQLQQALARRFPLRYPAAGLFDLHVRTPHLRTLPDQNRLLAEMAIEASGPALHRAHEGSFDVDFTLRYEASDRTLRAQDLRLSRLRFPTLRPDVVKLLDAYAPALAAQSLQEVVLHQLQPQDLKAIDAMGMQPGPITVTDTGLVIGLVLKPL